MKVSKDDKMEAIYFKSNWEQHDINFPHEKKEEKCNSIIFSNEDNIKELLMDSCNYTVLVRTGDEFAKLSKTEYRINSNNKEDYDMLIHSVFADNIAVDRVVHAWNLEEATEEYEESLGHSVYSVLYLAQAFLKNKIYRKISIVYLYEYSCSVSRVINKAIAGLAKVVELEQPLFRCKIVGLSKTNNYLQTLKKEIEDCNSYGCSIYYKENTRLEKCYVETGISDEKKVLKMSGVYVITGGMGGLGKLFAEKLLAKYSARIALIGRSELSGKNEKWLKKLVAEGNELFYVRANLAVSEQIQEALDKIIIKYGKIDGILHCAGALNDSYVINKTKEEFQNVLQSKVLGTINLDRILKDRELDFIALFSSLTSIKGNIGQCDYAYSNDFLNAFAEYRNELCDLKIKKGKTISINWPLWEHGGMSISNERKKSLLDNMKMMPLPDDEGFAAFESIVNSDLEQVAVVFGNRENSVSLMEANGDKEGDAPEIENQEESVHVDEKELQKRTKKFLTHLFSELFQISEERIKDNITMQEYGLDSVIVSKFNFLMEQEIGSLSKTVLYECQTIEELEQYLIANYKTELIKKFDLKLSEKKIKKTNAWEDEKKNIKWEKLESFISGNNPIKMPNSAVRQSGSKNIAIIGVAGKYPEAKNISEYWDNLKNGKDCISEIPSDRWDHEKYFDDEYQQPKPGKYYCKYGGFLKDIDQFDPLQFKISPSEATIMDPQERLLLESVWETFEDAGYMNGRIKKVKQQYNSSDIGVFIGTTNYLYQLWAPEEWVKGNYIMPSSSAWSVSNRISYVFNLSGPSMTIDTACSSSLVAIHQACESIMNGECEMAIAGGGNLYLHPYKYIQMCCVHMLSPSGKCHSFGNEGDGFVPGEGIGTILLKPLEKAIADNDHIYGIIKGTAVNHGGKTSGYSVPNPLAQQCLIERAIEDSGIDPRTISYIEAHGTGTILGDPIEISALTKAFQKYTDSKHYCSIGSVKTNIGHLEAAAGIAGITKLILQMKYKKLVPSLHAEVLNPNIDFENSPFYVQRELTEWKRPILSDQTECPLRAGISSFGAGGMNAHIILEEYIQNENNIMQASDTEKAIAVLSAQTDTGLKEYVYNLISYLENIEQNDDTKAVSFVDIAYSLCVGREIFDVKLAIVADSIDDFIKKLKAYYAEDPIQSGIFCGKGNHESQLSGYFADDDDAKEMIDRWIEKGKLEKVAAMWADGVEVDWNYIFRNKALRRISLPECSLQKKAYWIKKANDISDGCGVVKVEDVSDKMPEEVAEKDLIYTTKWQLQKLMEPSVKPEKKEAICIVANKKGGELQKALKAMYDTDQVDLIILGEKTSSSIPEETLSKLLNADVIYFLGGIQETNYDLEDVALYKKYEKTGVLVLFKIIQEIAKRNTDRHKITLKILTNNVYCVSDGDFIQPFAANIIGFVKSAAKSYPFLKMCYIDVSMKDIKQDSARLACMICDEKEQKKDQDIAIRDGKRFVHKIFKLELEHNEKQASFQNNGVYIIIGGMGSIGSDCAKYLSKNYHARLVIVGRSKIGTAQEKMIRQIEGLGGSVLYISADISVYEQIEHVVAETERIYGHINGIIHTAMVFNKLCSIDDLNETTMKECLSPKTIGVINLYKAIKDKTMDFLMLFSSGQSLVGNADRSHYAAACTFEDAYALAMAESLPFNVKIINWNFWATIKGEALDKNYHDYILDQGAVPIDTELGMRIIEEVLKSNGKQVFIFRIKNFVREWMGIDETGYIKIAAKNIRNKADGEIFDDLEKFVPDQFDGFKKALRVAQVKLLNAFRQQNVFMKADEEYDRERLFEKLGIILDYRQLFDELLRILERSDMIWKSGNKIRTTSNIEKEEIQKEISQAENLTKELSANDQPTAPYICLLETCMKELWPILRGEKLATEVLFSKSSTKLVEKIYKGNSMADYFNRLMVRAVSNIISKRRTIISKTEKIRILEIGAGTGGASAMILEALAEWKNQIQYNYTDISAFFANYGKETYGTNYPFAVFGVFDVEKNIISQGYDAGTYDIVIASNVLHATKDIRNTIRNAKALLACGGWLVLNEAVKIGDINTLTFGLTQGWWLFTDPEERLEGGPLLSTPMWKSVLIEEGFCNVKDLASTDLVNYEFVQNVIVAQSNGEILLQNGGEGALQCEKNPGTKVEKSTVSAETPVLCSSNIQETIIDCVSDVLSMDREDIRLNKSFMDYGVDSILGGTLIQSINERLNTELKPIELFDYSDIEGLTQHIIKEYGEMLQKKCLAPEAEMEADVKRNADVMPEAEESTLPEDDAEMLELFEKLEKGEIDMEQVYQNLGVLGK